MRPAFGALIVLLIASTPAAAQWVITDPANTARNTLSATLEAYLLATQQAERAQLDRMSGRLSRLTNLRKYALPDAPEWRIHLFLDDTISALARDYHAALNYGDPTGHAILAASHPLVGLSGLPVVIPSTALRALAARVATIQATDAVLIAGTNNAGWTRYNGRLEQAAIDALESAVTDGSELQSTTAVAEKVSGARLVAARQSQARLQLLTSVVEQLVMDSKRARDAEAAALDMQLVTWRDGRAANDAFVAGTGDALRTWRQP